MNGVRPLLSHAVTSALSALLLTFMAVSCIPLPGSNDSRDPLSNPEFLNPVAEAEEAGVRVYWLGEQFQAGSLTFGVGGANEFIDRPEGPGLEFSYSGDTGRGNVAFNVESYSAQGGGATPPLGGAAVLRERALAVRGATSRDVRVGNWDGELLSIPSATRPVNQLWLFVDLGETIVVGQAFSGGPGIPGEDPNPLIQADLLIDLMTQLRPYPE